jgi:hypothetical protein
VLCLLVYIGKGGRERMADKEHLDILKQGVKVWNKWREEHPEIKPDLKRAYLENRDLSRINLNRSILTGAYLRQADLCHSDLSEALLSSTDLMIANLEGADLSNAHLSDAILEGAILTDADLNRADLCGADLSGAVLRGAILRHANLQWSILSGADFTNVDLTGISIYACSAWNIQLKGAIQEDLIITNDDEPVITVDNLEVSQFIYLLLKNQNIRRVIDTITSKVVLILGRFTPERKQVLDALRNELRNCNYSPVVFDFEKPESRDLTETVSILARLSRFIIADITDPSCIPQELYAVVPDCLVPIQPLLSSQPVLIDGNEVERRPYSMFKDLQRRYHWVLPTYKYQDTNQLLSSIEEHIITPAEEKGKELERRKNGSI